MNHLNINQHTEGIAKKKKTFQEGNCLDAASSLKKR